MEHIDKELDIGYIIKKIRALNVFMKMSLDKDQRKLLKMRVSQFINSDEDIAMSKINVKKVVDKKKMLEMIVNNLRNKKINDQDIKLLKIIGLEEILNILKFRESYH
jgi:hypothetical protein